MLNFKNKKIIFLISLVVSLLLFSTIISATNSTIAYGGNVTELFLHDDTPVDWYGIYGQITYTLGAPYQSTINVTPGHITESNRTLQLACADFTNLRGYLLFSSESISMTDMNSLTPGNLTYLDSLINQSGTNATKTFTKFESYQLSTTTYTNVPTVYSNSQSTNSTFKEGYFQHGIDILFLSKIVVNETDYKNTFSDYQIILPVIDGIDYYYTYFDLEYDCPTTTGGSGGGGGGARTNITRRYIFDEDVPLVPEIKPITPFLPVEKKSEGFKERVLRLFNPFSIAPIKELTLSYNYWALLLFIILLLLNLLLFLLLLFKRRKKKVIPIPLDLEVTQVGVKVNTPITKPNKTKNKKKKLKKAAKKLKKNSKKLKKK